MRRLFIYWSQGPGETLLGVCIVKYTGYTIILSNVTIQNERFYWHFTFLTFASSAFTRVLSDVHVVYYRLLVEWRSRAFSSKYSGWMRFPLEDKEPFLPNFSIFPHCRELLLQQLNNTSLIFFCLFHFCLNFVLYFSIFWD